LMDDVKVGTAPNNVLVGWRYGAGCPIEGPMVRCEDQDRCPMRNLFNHSRSTRSRFSFPGSISLDCIQDGRSHLGIADRPNRAEFASATRMGLFAYAT
jgi:hypothetical protein